MLLQTGMLIGKSNRGKSESVFVVVEPFDYCMAKLGRGIQSGFCVVVQRLLRNY